jgi:hypothetical protein
LSYFLSDAGVASAVVAFLLPQSLEALADLSLHDEEHDDEDDFLSALSVFLVPSALGSLSSLKTIEYEAELSVKAIRLLPEKANTNANTDSATIAFFMLF